MSVNGGSIYGTGPSPFEQPAWGRATTKEDKLYLHVFDWPNGNLSLPALENGVERAYLLASPDEALSVEVSDEGLTVNLPNRAPDPYASVVVLDLDGSPQSRK